LYKSKAFGPLGRLTNLLTIRQNFKWKTAAHQSSTFYNFGVPERTRSKDGPIDPCECRACYFFVLTFDLLPFVSFAENWFWFQGQLSRSNWSKSCCHLTDIEWFNDWDNNDHSKTSKNTPIKFNR
jgi:hypothetical protein